MNRRFLSFFAPFLLLCSVSTLCAAADKHPAPAAPQPFLATTFAGWNIGTTHGSAAPQAADPANAEVLKEYGFTEFESAVYARDDNQLTVRALRFADASGAYGAYTFYRRPGMKAISVGEQAAFDGASHIIFWSGSIVCDAVFQQLTASSGEDLRELVNALPKPASSAATPPNLPGYLPKDGLDASATRYALGPISYAQSGGVLPPTLVDFSRGAEALTAQYSGSGGDGALTIINYPTPQIAGDRLRAIQSFLAQHDPAAPQALTESSVSSIRVRRSGPLVILTTGNFLAARADKLSNEVHYDADVTYNNPKGYVSEETKTAKLILGIFYLIGAMLGITIIIGIFLGTGRILYRRLRGKPATSMEEMEFIKLDLR
jgi:hypothetical protein